jgi:hypothetical protein
MKSLVPESLEGKEMAMETYKLMGPCVASYDCEVCDESWLLSGFHGISEFHCEKCGQKYVLILNYYTGQLYKVEKVIGFLKNNEMDLPDWKNKEWKEYFLKKHGVTNEKVY